MISFANVPPEAMEALCTPMHPIISASPQQHRGALYLGSFAAILDAHLLTSHDIGAVVQVLESPYLPSVEAHAAEGNKLDCCRIDIHDSTNTDLRPHLESTVRWIDDKLRQGINVLVHCQQVRFFSHISLRVPCLTQVRDTGYLALCVGRDRVPHLHPQDEL